MKLAIYVSITLLSMNAAGADNNFAGTWELLSVERMDSQGEWGRPSNSQFYADSVGLLMYDEFGYMSVHIMNSNRATVTSNGSDLTREELQETIDQIREDTQLRERGETESQERHSALILELEG